MLFRGRGGSSLVSLKKSTRQQPEPHGLRKRESDRFFRADGFVSGIRFHRGYQFGLKEPTKANPSKVNTVGSLEVGMGNFILAVKLGGRKETHA